MSHVNYTDFRKNLASYMDKVSADWAPLVVTRQNAGSVVIMAEEEYEALMETLHILRVPANASHLLASIAELDAGKTVEHDLTL